MNFKISRLRPDRNELYLLRNLWQENIEYHRAKLPEQFGEDYFSGQDLSPGWKDYYSWLTIGTLSDNIIVFLALINGEAIGYCTGQIINPPRFFGEKVGYVSELFVGREYSNRGLGQALLFSVTKWFQNKGVKRVETQYYVGNREAEIFWTKQGYIPLVQRMVKKLGEDENA